MPNSTQNKNDAKYKSKIRTVIAGGSLRKAKSLLKEVDGMIASGKCSPFLDGADEVRSLRLFVMTNGKGLPNTRNSPRSTARSSSPSNKKEEEEGDGIHWFWKGLLALIVILYVLNS